MLSPFAMLANNQKYFTSENKEHRQHDEDLFDEKFLWFKLIHVPVGQENKFEMFKVYVYDVSALTDHFFSDCSRPSSKNNAEIGLTI